MKSKQVRYYSYKRLRKITAPKGRPWQTKASELPVVKVHHTFDTFDDLVDYLDNSGTERELHIWMVSSELPYRIRPNKLEKMHEHGTVFHNKWYSFEITGWTFYKQGKVNKEKKN